MYAIMGGGGRHVCACKVGGRGAQIDPLALETCDLDSQMALSRQMTEGPHIWVTTCLARVRAEGPGDCL